MFGFGKRGRRAKLREATFPAEWAAILDANVPLFHRLPEGDREELRGLIQVFLAEKVFEGCGGLAITDEVRVTVAAQACLLLLRRDTDFFPKVVTVLVYPSAYVSDAPHREPAGVVVEGPEERLGEAWEAGVVVLSWDDVRRDSADLREGLNVVLHEFAHQLDHEDGAADGTPILPGRGRLEAWSRVMGDEFDRLRRDDALGRRSVLDPYGATDPAEFFAVATESFFLTPGPLAKKHPELYGQLKAYYAQDPARDHVAARPPRAGR